MTPDGEVIWTICCDLLNDNIPVRAMGVQVGGLRSARGVVGNWYERYAPTRHVLPESSTY